ncbi:MAG: tetratricopeptide repeat protein [Acidobacteriota bacterium]
MTLPTNACRIRIALVLVVASGWTLAGAGAAPQPASSAASNLAQVQELVDGNRPNEALELVDSILAQDPKNAEALLLRSTARLMVGEREEGRQDLERALALDPQQRRGWLNRAALDIAEERYEAALESFQRAEAIDPKAPDNDLNIGAVELLLGKLKPASERFGHHLAANPRSADAQYLVATNYALAGYAALALQHLRQAIDLDEVARLRARTEPNFQSLVADRRYQELLNVDRYRVPAEYYNDSTTFETPYDAADPVLLSAVIDSLQLAGRPFDPRVEVTDRWALIRGDLRIKVYTFGGKGLVQVSAPPDRFTPTEWRQRTEELFRGIEKRILDLTMRLP